jgi:hypothetical protein
MASAGPAGGPGGAADYLGDDGLDVGGPPDLLDHLKLLFWSQEEGLPRLHGVHGAAAAEQEEPDPAAAQALQEQLQQELLQEVPIPAQWQQPGAAIPSPSNRAAKRARQKQCKKDQVVVAQLRHQVGGLPSLPALTAAAIHPSTEAGDAGATARDGARAAGGSDAEPGWNEDTNMSAGCKCHSARLGRAYFFRQRCLRHCQGGLATASMPPPLYHCLLRHRFSTATSPLPARPLSVPTSPPLQLAPLSTFPCPPPSSPLLLPVHRCSLYALCRQLSTILSASPFSPPPHTPLHYSLLSVNLT